jgi:murein L,D-transpeptidase YafK
MGARLTLRGLSIPGRLLAPLVGLALALGSNTHAVRAPTYSDSGPEPMLARVFAAVERGRLDDALAQTDALIGAYPNFRLGHLIRGDLLLARARPLQTLGNAANAPQDKLSDLREEAIARLKGYRDKPRAGYLPRYLLQMTPEQKHAVVVDTRRSRLYVYENVSGKPRFVADYYVTHGKAGAEKSREGDKKTPVGVYHVTSSLPKSKLSDFYGSGAFPISYPNEWDRRLGRNGHGIWLHGTPSDTFSRPPRASDGCVVLANQDLDALAKTLQPGLTPVIISNAVEWLSLDDWQAERGALLRQIEEWRRDWESRDVDRFLRHYSRRFLANGQDYEQWAKQKRSVAGGKTSIKVAVDKLGMFRSPGGEELVVVTFDQDYRSNNLNNLMSKRQYWIKEDGRWKIIYEGAA